MYDLERCKKECEEIASAKGYPIDVPIEESYSNRHIASVFPVIDKTKDYYYYDVKKIVFYNPGFFELSDEECRDIIIHEMAHYLDLKRTHINHHHGSEFKKIIYELGGTKETCKSVRHYKEKAEG